MASSSVLRLSGSFAVKASETGCVHTRAGQIFKLTVFDPMGER